MSKNLENLKLLEQSLLGLKAQMGVVFTVMDKIDVLKMNKEIKSSPKEEIEKMKDINKLFDEVNYFWKHTEFNDSLKNINKRRKINSELHI